MVIYGGGSPALTKEKKVSASLDLTDKWGPYAKGRELHKWGAGSLREDRQSMFFALRAHNNSIVFPIRNDGKEGRWRLGQETKMIKDGLIDPEVFHWELRPFDEGVSVDGTTERWVPYEKIRDINKAFGWSTWLESLATNADGTKSIKEIFGTKVFDTPKPVALIEWVLDIVGDSECTILDSFAGSGTTAHAVLAANKKDDGNRKFILVECEDYADKLTAERVRRVIKGYKFTGTQREELLRKSLTYTDLKKTDKLLNQIASIENLDGHRFDSIDKKVKDGELIVEGVKSIAKRTEGLGGSFTYCTLGAAIEMDKLQTGESLPSIGQLGALLFHVATNEAFTPANAFEEDGHGYLGESTAFHVWLIYKPDLDFLKSREAALTLSTAQALVAAKPGKRHLVFAPARFVSQKLLNEAKLPVEFGPLPFALYRVERG